MIWYNTLFSILCFSNGRIICSITGWGELSYCCLPLILSRQTWWHGPNMSNHMSKSIWRNKWDVKVPQNSTLWYGFLNPPNMFFFFCSVFPRVSTFQRYLLSWRRLRLVRFSRHGPTVMLSFHNFHIGIPFRIIMGLLVGIEWHKIPSKSIKIID